MERFEVKRGLVKQVTAEGGLVVLASRHFEVVEADGENSFSGSHDIMTSIVGHYSDKGALIVDVTNVPPNFDDPDAMARAQDTRKRWTTFQMSPLVTIPSNEEIRQRNGPRRAQKPNQRFHQLVIS